MLLIQTLISRAFEVKDNLLFFLFHHSLLEEYLQEYPSIESLSPPHYPRSESIFILCDDYLAHSYWLQERFNNTPNNFEYPISVHNVDVMYSLRIAILLKKLQREILESQAPSVLIG